MIDMDTCNGTGTANDAEQAVITKKGKRHSTNYEKTSVKKRKKKNTEAESSTNEANNALPSEVMDSNKEQSKEFQVETKKPPVSVNGTSLKNVDNNSEEEIIPEEKIVLLDGKHFRRNFNSENGFDALKKFIKLCNDDSKQDIVWEYLQAGGSILEILKLLSRSDKKNISNATTVFSATSTLLVKIMTQHPQYQASANEACRHLLNSHLSLIHSMMSTESNAKQRKVVLKLLAAMVSLGGSLPRELLAHLSLQPQVLESLVQQTKPTDNQSIRTCFIHFVLAFLVEGNVPTIRSLLEKRGLVSSIFPQLIYDSKEVVHLVLTTIRNYVLENPGISKTMKLHVFSTPVIQSIVCLYNWKGPNNWPKGAAHADTSSPAYLENKEAVMEIVHNFLITLLTSNRHGVAFHDRLLSTDRSKHNQVVNTVLQSLDRPWEHDKPSDLVVKILIACPDLIKSQLNLLEPYIEPRASMKWIAVMKFVTRIMESVHIETCLKSCSSKLHMPHLISVVTSLTMPTILIKNVIVPSLNQDSITVRHEGILLLKVMFDQIEKFLIAIKALCEKGTDFVTFKSQITEYIVKNVPNLNTILKVWNDGLTVNEDAEAAVEKEFISEPKIIEHLNSILNLLHAYSDVCPELLDTAVNLQPSTLLIALNELENVDVHELDIVKIKAIKFLLALDSTEFAPQKQLFREVLSFVIPLLREEESTVSSYAKETIKTLLNGTGMFEGCNIQLDIWIHGFLNIDNEVEKREVTNWFVDVMKKAARHTEKYIKDIMEVEEIANHEVAFAGKLEDIFSELLDNIDNDDPEHCKGYTMLQPTSLSPLLSCVLCKMKKNPSPAVLSYVSYVLLHTLHYQVIPACLIYLAKDTTELPGHSYLMSWQESANQPTRIKIMFPSMSLISKVSSAILADTKIALHEVFHGDSPCNFKCGNEDISVNYSLSPYETMNIFKMAVFYLTQSASRGTLTKMQNENVKTLLIFLLHVAKNAENQKSCIMEDCIESIFSHPVILQYFSPCNQKHKDSIKHMITATIFDLCIELSLLCDKHIATRSFYHFKNKLFTELNRMIEKKQEGEKLNNVGTITTMLGVLGLTPKNTVHILTTVINLQSSMFLSSDKSDLSIYGYILPKLLQIACSQEMRSKRDALSSLDAAFITHLCTHLLFLKSNHVQKSEIWETVLLEYCSTYPHTIAGINTNTFLALLSKEVVDSTVKLVSFLVNRNTKLTTAFMNYFVKLKDVKETNIVLPVMASNLSYKWNQVFLQKVGEQYQEEIVSYLSDCKAASTWTEESINAMSCLIEHTFDLALCEKICHVIMQSGDKLEMVPTHYLRVLKTVYNKYAVLKKDSKKPVMDLIQVLVHIHTLTLKKESKNLEKLNILCHELIDAVKSLKEKDAGFMFESLSNSHSWPQFTRFSLKLGLKESKNDKLDLPILQTLNVLLDVAYKNNSDNEYVKTLFEMTTSHSEFMNTMLSSSTIKKDLVELLWILIRKNKIVMGTAHLPLYLAAYNASLSEADQIILLILKYYEENNINSSEYRPFLWGNAAATHYSVKGELDMALWRQPSTTQVLNLIEKEIVVNTIRHYPINRGLRNNEVYKASDECDVYDPAFYLPLLCSLLSENNLVACHKITQTGALALALSACGSSQSDVRMLAYTVISRYYLHVEASSSKTKLLWMRLIDSLRAGIMSLESELVNVRLSSLVSTFLARASLIATQPLSPLFSPLQTFLMAKPALDVKSIPELLQLFHSPDVEHKAHRHWILEIIRDGMKTEIDVELAFKCVLFKILLDFYTCSLSDTDTKKLILDVIHSATRINKGATVLIYGHGVLPWLLYVVKNLQTGNTYCINIIIKIIDNLLNALSRTKGEADHYRSMILKIMLNLRPHLSKDIEIHIFTLYINILQKLFTSRHLIKIVATEVVKEFVDISRYFVENLNDCEDMLHHGCDYVNKPADYLQSYDKLEIAKLSVKRLIWTWFNHKVR